MFKIKDEIAIKRNDIQLSLLCIIEIQSKDDIIFNDLKNLNEFEKKLSEKLKEIRNLGIDIKFENCKNPSKIGKEIKQSSIINKSDNQFKEVHNEHLSVKKP